MIDRHSLQIAFLSIASVISACEDRNKVWDQPVARPTVARGLSQAVALIDPPAERVLFLSVEGDLSLTPVSIPIGHGFAAAESTADKNRLLILSHGDNPKRNANDQDPTLLVVNATSPTYASARYALSDPLSSLLVDPQGAFAVLHASDQDQGFVQNPNELIFVNLNAPQTAQNPTPFTLRSFGGRPQHFAFTPLLSVPGGPRRLLVVETDRDVALVDLSDLSKPDITVKLTGGSQILNPVGVAITDGDPMRNDDARIAIRLQDNPNVVILTLGPTSAEDPSASRYTFRPMPNVIPVSGNPTDLAFVQTDLGLRLAAPVPSRSVLSLIDPATGGSKELDVGAPFEHLSVITNLVGSQATTGIDIALLWSSTSSTVAFVKLALGVDRPQISTISLAEPIGQVLDVPHPNERLKVLAPSSGGNFVVLDVIAHTASTLVASANGTQFTLSADGGRGWMFAPGSLSVAQVDLLTLHPRNVRLSEPIQNIFDIQRHDGGRALLALHDIGAGGFTVLDAQQPALTNARQYAALLAGGLLP